MKSPKPKLNRQILDEASEWFVDFRVGDVDSSARERFDLWLRQSPEHIRAYMEIANTYVVLPALNPTRKVDVQELIAYARSEGNVVALRTEGEGLRIGEGLRTEDGGLRKRGDLPRQHSVLSTQSSALSASLSPQHSVLGTRPRLFYALAASIAIVFVTASWLAVQWHSTYATDIGERRSITLEDGSTIDLNARSKVRVQFSKGERHVELLEGQALFGVAHDVSRPFIVRSGTAVVRAVGTQFDVYRKRSGTTVTVVEGRVAVFTRTEDAGLRTGREDLGTEDSGLRVGEVTSAEDPGLRSGAGPRTESRTQKIQSSSTSSSALSPQSSGLAPSLSPQSSALSPLPGEVFVSAGEQVTITEREVAEPKRTNIAATTAWTQHRLIFDATPLGDVVDEFNRYNTHQLVIEDRALDDFHVSGVYSSTDPASLIRFLRQQPGIDVIETDEGVRITRK